MEQLKKFNRSTVKRKADSIGGSRNKQTKSIRSWTQGWGKFVSREKWKTRKQKSWTHIWEIGEWSKDKIKSKDPQGYLRFWDTNQSKR